MGDNEKPNVYYKLVCRQCNDDGYVEYVCRLPIDAGNIHPPDGEDFEILPYDGMPNSVKIRHKCNICNGLKYYIYCSDGWKLEKVHPKREKD
jgi:hypothetical protein